MTRWSVPRQPPDGTIDLTRLDNGSVELKLYAGSGSFKWISVSLTDEQRHKLIVRLQRFDDPADGGKERRKAPRRLT